MRITHRAANDREMNEKKIPHSTVRSAENENKTEENEKNRTCPESSNKKEEVIFSSLLIPKRKIVESKGKNTEKKIQSKKTLNDRE